MFEIKLQVNDKIKDNAVSHSKERMSYEYNRFNLSKEKRQSMILIGTIGQLIFKQFLEENQVDFDFEFQAGNYDDIDFKIANEIFEVKTSGYSGSYKHLNLFYSEDQYRRGLFKDYNYCVQIYINGYNKSKKLIDIEECDTAIIAGYIEFDRIKSFKQKRQFYGDDYKVPQTAFKDIKKLLKIK
jgi:hypothetical protein